ncbi:carboxypeptidase S1 [Cordyceps fumosorosea ARSEF 2679]|uniref:Carboxypeptidase n=1 Tax=Cordyceps fumosorosea (strain ARSEF 2679) TaxID=1081104 RepID=A0A168BSX1_CORFA|nr:carboxypeptidase S1 [Cordyceps fumosorosea ARSEF 2679]OAA70508.1 carboxypeptidase S1 [Cordyceps fumosorosea ARSEF 2679]
MAALLSTLLLLLAATASAQFVNQEYHSRNFNITKSPGNSNITVAYKEPNGTCKTAFTSQKQYTGWVSVPGDYATNLFFWFVEAREKTDKLTIWLNGGPGSSSMYGFFTGNGPCAVVEKGLNTYDTVTRDWGWDRGSNIIFIDQPNQVGFSYDVPSNGTMLFPNGTVILPPYADESSKNPWSITNGTFSTMNVNSTANTTEKAAFAVWHMLQGFLGAFPQYLPPAPQPVSINLFAESYGGRYGPIFADVWEQQNQIRQVTPAKTNSTRQVNLASLGIVNGCVDQEIQQALSPKFATANTYGFKAYSDEEAKFYTDKFSAAGGCAERLRRCASLSAAFDINGTGTVDGVNQACQRANAVCNDVDTPYYAAGRSVYDLSAPLTDPFPSFRFVDYLNQGSVLAAIGSPVNYTMNSNAVYFAFDATGDLSRGQTIPRIAKLLNQGVRIGLIYGDRDYICHWFGGEAVSLQVAKEAGGQYLTQFPAAGYSPIIVNSSYIGGEVRQFGNLSFSRIYQSGHSVASYQPETAFQIFSRLMAGTSVSTGQSIDINTYSTSGPVNSTTTAKLPKMQDTVCYIRAFQDTCDKDSRQLAASGSGVVINGILYSSSADWPLMTQTATSTKAATTKTSSATLTGAYTATSTPKNSAQRASPSPAFCIVVVLGAALLPVLDWI